MFRLMGALVLSLFFMTTQAQATLVTPTNYDMPNGDGQGSPYFGTYNYWDKEYTGAGNTASNGDWLHGGLGNLTDGITTTQNWFNIENVEGTGPYVGWKGIDPTILFYFPATYDFTTLHIHFDDADGTGGVSSPSGIKINGLDYSIGGHSGSDPFWADIAFNYTGSNLEVQLLRGGDWVFADEVTFEGSEHRSVPEPASVLLLLSGLGLIVLRRFRKQQNSAVA